MGVVRIVVTLVYEKLWIASEAVITVLRYELMLAPAQVYGFTAYELA